MIQTAMKLSRVEDEDITAKFSVTSLTNIVDKCFCIDLPNSWAIHKVDINSLFSVKL